jgi:hypothetical protein
VRETEEDLVLAGGSAEELFCEIKLDNGARPSPALAALSGCLPSEVPLIQLTSVTKRLASMVRRIAPVWGSIN